MNATAVKSRLLRSAPTLLAVLIAGGGVARGTQASATDGGIRERYRQVLVICADHGPDAALEALITLERAADGEDLGQLEALRDQQLSLVHDRLLVGRALLPIIALHERAYLAYLKQDLSLRAYQSRTTAIELGELFSEQGTAREDRMIASDLWASLAGYFQETSASDHVSGELYRKSLRLDRSNEAALAGLAFSAEQAGRYLPALRRLEQLAAAYPGNAEARLRLAINLDRFGRRPEAETMLWTLLRHEAIPDWALVLAHQELARLLLATGELTWARRVLVWGHERFPRDSTLTIGLAFLEELDERHEASLFEALERTAEDSNLSPRYRYSRPPDGPLERARERLRARTRESLEALARGLVD